MQIDINQRTYHIIYIPLLPICNGAKFKIAPTFLFTNLMQAYDFFHKATLLEICQDLNVLIKYPNHRQRETHSSR